MESINKIKDNWEELFDFQYNYRKEKNITAYRMTIILGVSTTLSRILAHKFYSHSLVNKIWTEKNIQNTNIIQLYIILNNFKENIDTFNITPFINDINKTIEINNNIKLIKDELDIENCNIYYDEEKNRLNVHIIDANYTEKYTEERIKRIISKYIDNLIEIDLAYLEFL